MPATCPSADHIRVTNPPVPSTVPLQTPVRASTSTLLRETVTLVRSVSCRVIFAAAPSPSICWSKLCGSVLMTLTPVAAADALASLTSAAWWRDRRALDGSSRNRGSWAHRGAMAKLAKPAQQPKSAARRLSWGMERNMTGSPGNGLRTGIGARASEQVPPAVGFANWFQSDRCDRLLPELAGTGDPTRRARFAWQSARRGHGDGNGAHSSREAWRE